MNASTALTGVVFGNPVVEPLRKQRRLRSTLTSINRFIVYSRVAR